MIAPFTCMWLHQEGMQGLRLSDTRALIIQLWQIMYLDAVVVLLGRCCQFPSDGVIQISVSSLAQEMLKCPWATDSSNPSNSGISWAQGCKIE